MSFEILFSAIRESADKAIWSKAVELSRRDAVTGETVNAHEVVFRVLDREKGLGVKTTLYLQDSDWLCDCHSDEDPCLHVVTAAIAYKRAREQGQELPKSKTASGKVLYVFKKVHNALALERYVGSEGQEPKLLNYSVQSIVAGRLAEALTVQHVDVAIERALRYGENKILKPDCVSALFEHLSQCEDLQFDGDAVTCDVKAYRPEITVREHDHEIQVCVNINNKFLSFANGVVSDGRIFRPSPKPEDMVLLQKIVQRTYASRDKAVFLTEVLPQLKKFCNVTVEILGVGEVLTIPPHLEVCTEERDGDLCVKGRVVYGAPPIAFVENDHFEILGASIPQRDRAKELMLRDQFARHFGFNLGVTVSVSGIDAVAMSARIRKFEGDVTGEAQDRFNVLGALTAQITKGPTEDLTVLFVDQNGERFSTDRVLAAWRDGESHMHSPGQGFFSLPTEWLQQHQQSLARYHALTKLEDGAVKSYALASIARELDNVQVIAMTPVRPIADADLSGAIATMQCELRSYQRDGIAWMMSLRQSGFGALLADDMGLGKTLQACALLGRKSLIVCPTSLLANWKSELKRFRPDLSVSIYHGPNRRITNDDVTITSYALLRLDQTTIAAMSWQTAVLDEAHYIKNPRSQVAQAAYSINADFKIALSGTPLENKLEDLWSALWFTNRGLLGGLQDFQENYERPIHRGDQGLMAKLRALIAPFILRRLKTDVAKDLPPRTEIILRTQFSEEQKNLYVSLFDRTAKEVDDGLDGGRSFVEILELLLRIRQACCAPQLLPGVTLQESAKLDYLEEIFSEALSQNHKILVFSQWTSFLDLIQQRLEKQRHRYLRLDGSTKDRASVVNEFQSASQPTVLLMSLKAGGVGLNLTAADHVIITDPWWNPAAEDQAADRAHRIGQDKPVFIYKLIVEDSIEERILELQQRKKDLARAILTDATSEALSLTRDDIRGLFQTSP